MGKHLSEIDKGKILGLKKAGITQKEISTKTGIPTSTISNFLKRVNIRNDTSRKIGSGRLPLLNTTNLKKLKQQW